MRTIVYISNAVKLLDEKRLNELFHYVRQINYSKNITGILLYNEGTFIQILEGEQQFLNPLFESIKQDKRHNNITKMLDRSIGERLFNKYRTRFSTVYNYWPLDDIETFLKEKKTEVSHSQTILALLRPFLNKQTAQINAASG